VVRPNPVLFITRRRADFLIAPIDSVYFLPLKMVLLHHSFITSEWSDMLNIDVCVCVSVDLKRALLVPRCLAVPKRDECCILLRSTIRVVSAYHFSSVSRIC